MALLVVDLDWEASTSLTNHWFKCSLPPQCTDWHISDLDLLAHIICLHLWGHQWFGLQIHSLTDSEPCELLLQHGCTCVSCRLAMVRQIASIEHRMSFL